MTEIFNANMDNDRYKLTQPQTEVGKSDELLIKTEREKWQEPRVVGSA